MVYAFAVAIDLFQFLEVFRLIAVELVGLCQNRLGQRFAFR